MSAPSLETVGIKSELLEHLSAPGTPGRVRARFCIDNSETPKEQAFQPGDWLNVGIVARIYRLDELRRRLPDSPLAQGREELRIASTEWNTVDLELPPMPPGEYGVVAKVYSRDDRYRRNLSPSNCYIGVVKYALEQPTPHLRGNVGPTS